MAGYLNIFFSGVKHFFIGNASVVKKALACMVLLLFCVVPALFVNNLIGYLPALVVLAGIAYLGIYALVIRHSVVFEELSNLKDCQRGSAVDFVVRLKNKSPLLLSRVEPNFYISNLFGEDESVMKRVTSLGPFEEREFSFSIRFDHIGSYSAGIRSIEIYDLLGFFTVSISNVRRYEVTVSPRIYDIARLEVANQLTSESQKMLTSTINDGMDYAGMRDYAMGDPMKAVHWKMSARSRKLITKLYETFMNPTITVIFDFHTYPYDPETMMCVFDAVVESGFSIDNYARYEQIESTLLFQDSHKRTVRRTIKDRDDYGLLAHEMPKISSSDMQGAAVELLKMEAGSAFGSHNLVVCSSYFDEALASALVVARNRGKNPMLIGVVPENMPQEQRKRIIKPLRGLETAGVPYCILGSAKDMKEKLW